MGTRAVCEGTRYRRVGGFESTSLGILYVGLGPGIRTTESGPFSFQIKRQKNKMIFIVSSRNYIDENYFKIQ